MKLKNMLAIAAVCFALTSAGCSKNDNSSSHTDSNAETTTATSIVTVTDDSGNTVTDTNGEAVTTIVTVTTADEKDSISSDEDTTQTEHIVVTDDKGQAVTDSQGQDVTSIVNIKNEVTTVSYVTSLSETVVTTKVTVTDSKGDTVTDSEGVAKTEIVTTVSKVVVTVPVTTTKTTTTARTIAQNNATATAGTTTTTTTASDSSAATSTAASSSSVQTTTTRRTTTTTTAATTTTTATTTTAGDITLNYSDIDFPSAGDSFGTVSIPVVNIEMDLYMGDTDKILRKGIGLYYGSYLPGCEGKSIMCGHNSSGYLADLVTYAKSNSMIGQQILVNTTYGDYVYEIYETQILTNDNTTYFTTSYDTSTLILYSCMESDYTNERIYFVAKKVSGPVLVAG